MVVSLIIRIIEGVWLQSEDDDRTEYEEADEDDRDLFRDQLCTVGAFARLVPQHSLTLLTRSADAHK